MNGYNDDELQRMRRRRQARHAADGARGYASADGGRRPAADSRRYSGRTHAYSEENELDDAYFYEEEYGEAGRGTYRPAKNTASSRSAQRAPRTASGNRSQGTASAGRPQGTASANRSQGAASAGRPQGTASARRSQGTAAGRPGTERQRRGTKGGHLKYILIALLICILGGAAWMLFNRPTGYWTVAVFGLDSRDGNTKNALADVQMICSIDRETGEIKLVSVFRDTYLKIDSEGTYHKINEAYFKGGHEQAVAALEENLDLEIDDYAAFNWKTVAEAINVLGGIDLEITDAEFAYINSFITETVESTGIASVHLSQAGMNHLDGVQAVAYSRLRLMDTDFQRTERQRKVVSLALEKAKQADVSTLTSLAGLVISEISTSVGVDDLLPMVRDMNKYYIGETGGFPFSRQTARVGRMDCVIATTLESNDILLHQFLYGEDVSYSPSSAVREISSRISEETGLYEAGEAAPSGGGGSSGSRGSSGTGTAQPPETEPAPAETETAAAESVEESTEESLEESAEESEEETAEESEEESESTEEEEDGPGVSGPGGQSTEDSPGKGERPSREETEEAGPGVSGPGAGGHAGNSSSAGQSSRPGQTGENGPGTSGPGVSDSGSTEPGVSEEAPKAPAPSETQSSANEGPGAAGPGV